MKVAVICDVLGEANNGTTIALTNLINHLRSKGHDVKVVCPDADKKDKDGYVVVPVLKLTPLINWALKINGIVLAKPDKSILEEVIDWADVVHVEMAFPLGRRAAKMASQKGKPITASFHMQAENVTAHVGMMDFKPLNNAIYHWVYNGLFRYVSAVHYPTQFIEDTFEDTVHKKLNSFVISNGVQRLFFDNRDKEYPRISDKFTILCSGRFSGEKAQWQLVKAVAKSKHKDDIKIFFAGSGPREKGLKKLARKKGVDAEFGFLDRQQMIAVQHAADLYVHTAIIEIEALCCIESLVSGLVPVICDSKRSATPAFALDGNNLYKDRDINDLASKIDFWYENPALKEQYKEKYKEKIRAFDQETCMEKMEDMLKSVI